MEPPKAWSLDVTSFSYAHINVAELTVQLDFSQMTAWFMTEDESLLQSNLDTMVGWANKWCMKFNPSKCTTMRITRGRNHVQTSYKMLGVDLEETQFSKYLGVFMQNDLR